MGKLQQVNGALDITMANVREEGWSWLRWVWPAVLVVREVVDGWTAVQSDRAGLSRYRPSAPAPLRLSLKCQALLEPQLSERGDPLNALQIKICFLTIFTMRLTRYVDSNGLNLDGKWVHTEWQILTIAGQCTESSSSKPHGLRSKSIRSSSWHTCKRSMGTSVSENLAD